MIGLSRSTATQIQTLLRQAGGDAGGVSAMVHNRPMSFVRCGAVDGDYYEGVVVVWNVDTEVWDDLGTCWLREANDATLTEDQIYLAQRVGADEDAEPYYQTVAGGSDGAYVVVESGPDAYNFFTGRLVTIGINPISYTFGVDVKIVLLHGTVTINDVHLAHGTGLVDTHSGYPVYAVEATTSSGGGETQLMVNVQSSTSTTSGSGWTNVFPAKATYWTGGVGWIDYYDLWVIDMNGNTPATERYLASTVSYDIIDSKIVAAIRS